jgi:hypothetical protein
MRPAQTTARVAMSLRSMIVSPSVEWEPPGPTPAAEPEAARLVRPLELKEIGVWPRCREQRKDASAQVWEAEDGQFRRQGEEKKTDAKA